MPWELVLVCCWFSAGRLFFGKPQPPSRKHAYARQQESATQALGLQGTEQERTINTPPAWKRAGKNTAKWTGGIAAACAVLMLAACISDAQGADDAKGAGDDAAAAQQAAMMPQVGVIIAKPATVGLVTELPGRVEASRVAQVRARAAGILLKRHFAEGSHVKAGQRLFTIDSAPYAASVQSAKASLASAEAAQAQAKALLDRYRPLVAVNAISKLDFDNANTSYKAAQANVAVAKAAVRTAEINLGYANVTAPISGRIGRALVTEGALVGQGEATQLAVVQQINPVYVNFTQSSSQVMALRKALADGKLQQLAGEEATPVQVVLEDGSSYGQEGKLLFTDLTVDETTGQVTLRAEVPNDAGLLLPGMYVRVKLSQAQVQSAIAVPQQAVTRSQQGDTVTVVDAEGNREVRKVTVGAAAQGNSWLITSGLKEGEQVMVDGFQLLQMMPPNVKVKAVPWVAGQPTLPQQGQQSANQDKQP